MEDQHTCETEIPGLPGHAFFAVYDGHGGKEAAIISNRTVLPCIQKQKQYRDYCAVSDAPFTFLHPSTSVRPASGCSNGRHVAPCPSRLARSTVDVFTQ
jgi:hypothetical protein